MIAPVWLRCQASALATCTLRLRSYAPLASPVRRPVCATAGATATALTGAVTSKRLERGRRVGVDRAAGFLEGLDVAPHQHSPCCRIDILVEHGNDAGTQGLAGGVGREIDAVHRIGAAEADRDRQQASLRSAARSRRVRAAGRRSRRRPDGSRRRTPRMKRIAPGHQHRGKALPERVRARQSRKFRGEIGPGMRRNRGIRVTQSLIRGGSAAAPQQADEKPVGLGRARRHQDALVRQPRRLGEHEGALAERIGDARPAAARKIPDGARGTRAPARRFPRRAPNR